MHDVKTIEFTLINDTKFDAKRLDCGKWYKALSHLVTRQALQAKVSVAGQTIWQK